MVLCVVEILAFKGLIVCESPFILFFAATEDTDPVKKTRKDDHKDGEAGAGGSKIPYPKQIFFIISMEACERFSYYGMNSKPTRYYDSLLHCTFSNLDNIPDQIIREIL